MDRLISLQAAIDAARDWYEGLICGSFKGLEKQLRALPSAKPEVAKDTNVLSNDCISRQAAIDAFKEYEKRVDTAAQVWTIRGCKDEILKLPSAQPERTCVNCGRTANNGGWYADGRTRCPIEEHYALPKDGFCHLWEKRNITDDDYPERMEE